jgi:serine protease
MKPSMISRMLFAAALAATTGVAAPNAHSQPAIGAGVAPVPVAALASRAEAAPIRVIVMLKPPAAMAAGRSETAKALAIARLQQEVITTVFGATPAALDAQGRGVKLLDMAPVMSFSATSDEILRLATDPRVQNVSEDRLMKPELAQSLPIIHMTGAGNAYALGATGAGRAVAILDTGVSKNHEFLKNKVVSEACYNTKDANYGSTSRCPGGKDASTAAGAGADCSDIFATGCGHGTHVAGIAAGRNTGQSPGEPVNGVAKAAKVVAINVFSTFSNPSLCGSSKPCLLSYQSDQMLALQRVYHLATAPGGPRIDAINMSLGGGATPSFCDTDSDMIAFAALVDQLRTAGVATVIAAGNDGHTDSVAYPGCLSVAITVAASSKRATDKPERVAIYSNLGPQVDLFAPGGDFNYPFNTSKDRMLSSHAGRYAYLAGTSMAAPHVAGAIAAIRSRAACRAKTVAEIETALQGAGLVITDWRSGQPLSAHRLDVRGAMRVLGCAP